MLQKKRGEMTCCRSEVDVSGSTTALVPCLRKNACSKRRVLPPCSSATEGGGFGQRCRAGKTLVCCLVVPPSHFLSISVPCSSIPSAKHQPWETPSETAWLSPVPLRGAAQWTGTAFQQGAICGTSVLPNNQICLWSGATALGHGAVCSAISFSIYKLLQGVVTVPTALNPASWERCSWARPGSQGSATPCLVPGIWA